MSEPMEATGYEGMDFMELFNDLTEQILESVREERKNDSHVLLATLLYHADNLYKGRLIDFKLYRKVLDFYKELSKDLLSV